MGIETNIGMGMLIPPEPEEDDCAPIEGVPGYGPQFVAGEVCSNCEFGREKKKRRGGGSARSGAGVGR